MAYDLFCNFLEIFKLLCGSFEIVLGLFISGVVIPRVGRNLLWNCFGEFEVKIKIWNCRSLLLLAIDVLLNIVAVSYQNSLEFWLFDTRLIFGHLLVNGLVCEMISGPNLSKSVELFVVYDTNDVDVALE